MPQYIAFLRAINVTNRFVKMENLRRLFQSLGLTRVQSYIQSGNILFETSETSSAELERSIEAHLQAALGFSVATFVRTPQETIKLSQFKPFPTSSHTANTTLDISLLKTRPSPALKDTMASHSSDVDQFLVHGKELFWQINREAGESKMTGARVEKILGMPATQRNSSTIHKIVKKYFQNE